VSVLKKIVTVVGARPQFVKAAAVSDVMRTGFKEILVDTGQHYDYKMSGVFFEELQIPKPDYQLGVGSGTHAYQTGTMLIGLENIMMQESPDAVLVYGDTNSTLAAAMAAAKLHIPLFHVEAGLRSYNKRMPEEINRVMADHTSALLFAPTETAVDNLRLEGLTEGVFQVGDVMYDAVLKYMDMAERKHDLKSFGVHAQSYYLATIHRAENTDNRDRLQAIVEGLAQMTAPVIMPIHPRTRKQLEQYGLYEQLADTRNIQMIEPVTYLEMLLLEKHAKGIVTDSGGVQKEAYFAGVPCFTLRDETEWTETVRLGWNRLINPLTEPLKDAIDSFRVPEGRPQVYGDGDTAANIVGHMLAWFGLPSIRRVS